MRLRAQEILPKFEFNIPKTSPKGMVGHGVVRRIHTVRFVVSYDHAGSGQGAQQGKREVIAVSVMQYADLPGSNLSSERRSEAVPRDKNCFDPGSFPPTHPVPNPPLKGTNNFL